MLEGLNTIQEQVYGNGVRKHLNATFSFKGRLNQTLQIWCDTVSAQLILSISNGKNAVSETVANLDLNTICRF